MSLTVSCSFGFLDGISQPALKDIDDSKVNPGQQVIPPGVILLGREGDKVPRPDWAKDGTFLAFRHLSQLVPEFNDFLEAHPISGVPFKQGVDLFGARLMGRWKSGKTTRHSISVIEALIPPRSTPRRSTEQ